MPKGVAGDRAQQMRESRRAVEDARRALLRAAAALTEAPTRQVLAFALLEACIGLLCIARADAGEEARGEVEARLRDLMRPR